jgi:hypothetical protein
VRAIESKAKISGLLIQRTEIGSPGSFDGLNTLPEIVDALIDEELQLYPQGEFTAEDKRKITDQLQTLLDTIASCSRKPVKKGEFPYVYDYDPQAPKRLHHHTNGGGS